MEFSTLKMIKWIKFVDSCLRCCLHREMTAAKTRCLLEVFGGAEITNRGQLPCTTPRGYVPASKTEQITC